MGSSLCCRSELSTITSLCGDTSSYTTSHSPLSNVMLDLVKSSSIAAIISVPEIFQKAKVVGASEHDFMTMYILVAVIYWLICTAYSLVQAKLERRFALDI